MLWKLIVICQNCLYFNIPEFFVSGGGIQIAVLEIMLWTTFIEPNCSDGIQRSHFDCDGF